MPNPFDDLDNDNSGVLQEAPRPGLIDRFKTNFEAGSRQNTILGATFDAATSVGHEDRQRFDRQYESYPEWQGILEGGAALAGQIGGTAASPENFLPIGLGEKILVGGKVAVTGLWAKVFAGAVDSAASNAIADAAVQGIEIAGDNRESFDPVQYATSVLLGGIVGGIGGAAGKGLERLRGGKAAAGEIPAKSNPFDDLDEAAAPIANGPDVAAQAKPDPAPEPVVEAAPNPVVQAKPAAAAIDQVSASPARAETAAPSAPAETGTIGEVLSAKAAEVRGTSTEAAPASGAETAHAAGEGSAPAPEAKDAVPLSFETERGSTYEVSGPSTTRTKAARDLPGHEGDAGLKDPSELTVYVDENVGALSSAGLEGVGSNGSRVVLKDGKATLLTWNEKAGAWGSTESSRDIVYHSEPAVGRYPLELWKQKDDVPGYQAYSSMHAGNKIVKVGPTLAETRGAAKDVGDFLMAQPATGLQAQRSRGAPSAASSPAPQAAGRVQRVRETAEALAKAMNITATRQGRISGGKRVLGTFDTKDSVVRVRSLDDFDTLTHEYGHHLDAHVPDVKAFIKQNSKVLSALDYDPSKGRDYEGFAEFFRLWVTNRPYVQINMPALAGDFEKLLQAKAPDLAKAIDDATDAWDAFLKAPSTVAVRSTIVSAKKGGWFNNTSKELKKSGFGGTIAEVLQRIYTFSFDDLNPINRAVGYLKDLHLENKGVALDLNVSRDPYKLARMSRGSYASGHMDVMYGVAPYRGINPESPSLRDAIVEATGKPNSLSKWDDEKVGEFGAYLWSRRAVGEWERYRKGEIPNPPDKLTEADHLQNIKDLEAANAKYQSAAAKVHEFGRALWKKKLDAGLIDQETYARGLLIQDYVPGLRDFSNDTDMKVGGNKRAGGSTKGGFVKRFKGSKRDVINPLESMAADAYETAMTIARNDVVKSLHRLALNAGPGGGAIAELVPAKELRANMVDPLEAVQNAAKNAGLSDADITLLRDAVESAVGEEKAAVFRPAMINEKGEPIVFFRDGGDLKALRLADGKFGLDMYKSLTGMSQVERNFWLELVAMPARLLRAGITLSPEFIAANFVRDQFMASIFYGKPFQRVARTLQGATDDLVGSDVARSYSRMFGISGGAETASLSKAMAERDLAGLRHRGWAANRLTSFHGILETAEIAETATRVGLFRTFKDEAKKRGLDDYEALFEAAWRARDYMDFDRRGSGMAALSKVTPFLNASLQGLDKATRHMIAPLARKVLGQAQGPEDAAAVALAAKTWARLSVLVAGSVSLYALMSQHEDHDEISETTRATHWMIKSGEKWTAIPKPFEMAIAINLGEAVYDSWIQKDPKAMQRWRDSLFMTVMPPSVIESNPAIKSYFELKANNDFFTGAPIVPDQLQGMEPWLQYTARTSAIAKQLGYIFNEPPVVIDHLIVGHLGSWGRNAISLYDLAQPDAPGFAWDDAPIARRFIKDAAKGSQSVTMFWDQVSEREGKLEGRVKSWKAMAEAGDAAGAADYFASLPAIDKAYVAVSSLDADSRRLHPLIRARGGIQAISTVRRELASGRLTDGDGNPIKVSPAERTAADDILSSLAMAMARNGLKTTGVAGWEQRTEMDEDGFYRELEAVNPDLARRLGDAFADKRVWKLDAIKEAWPELKARALDAGSDAFTGDLVAEVKSAGLALDGDKRKRKKRPELVPDQ
ncbi:LPD38 domain-containing protein [Rhizobium sp. NPDC090275]|uniref:LPD38 domain-containing protein n=1 Tax=Rhizobium sp. NPDC090275 TaxID=3364498 RepID=UPI00383B1CB8